MTNDEWFGNSAAIGQHAAMAVFRAVENHVPLARSANTGLTMVVDAHGGVRARLPVLQAGVLTTVLPSSGLSTLYTSVGDWPAWIAFVGKEAYRGVFGERPELGVQERTLGATRLFVLPSTSPANAAVPWRERLRWFLVLRDSVAQD